VTGWLLDTNILSELRRVRPEPKVTAFVARQPLDLLYVSSVTFAEIRSASSFSPTPVGELNCKIGLPTTSGRCLSSALCR